MQLILLPDPAKKEKNPKLLSLDFCPVSGMIETCPQRNLVINIASVVFPEGGLYKSKN